MDYTALTEVFGDKLTYLIPPYQRPYSWDCIGKSEKNNQINIMWDDIYNFFIEKHKGLYFMGSMVLIPDNENERLFEVIDGQQRLTSLTSLIVAIRCFLKKTITHKTILYDEKLEEYIEEVIREVENVIFNKQLIGGITIEKKIKIEKNAEFDYDLVLKDVLDCSENPTTVDISTKYRDSTEEQKKIISRYYKNRKYFEEKFETEFLSNGKFTVDDFAKLNEFLDFLKTKLSFVIIKAKDFDFAYRIFETLNNRGLPLSNKDLFRNFIIEQFDAVKLIKPDIDPIKKWIELDTNYELKEDFIGRWVESKKAGQQKLSAFNDLKEIIYYSNDFYREDRIKKIQKIEFLYNDIKEDLHYYTLISNPSLISDIETRNKLYFLHNCGNNRYTINLLIALFRHFKYAGNARDEIKEFLRIYERFILHILLHPSKRFSSGPIYQAINELNNNDIDKAKKQIAEKTDIEELKKLITNDLKDNATAKLLVAKYIWYQQVVSVNDIISQTLHYDKATLEHIIPQSPESGSNWLNDFDEDFRKKFTYRLGNMTLLNLSLNAGANNHDYSRKKEYYGKTNLSFTKDVVKDNITPKVIEDRQLIITKGIFKDLDI